jgi:prolycopene isomerase
VPRYDAIVIGSGLGGSTAASLLALYGFRTVLLERNPRIGGSCSFYEKQGFHVDVGTHMFTRGDAGPFGYVQERLGIKPRLEFLRAEPIALVRGLGVDLAVPAAAWRAPRFLLETVRQLRIPPRDWPGLARLFTDILTMSPAQIDALDDTTVDVLVARYTDNPKACALFGLLLGLYFILPYWEVSAGEAVYCFQRMIRANALGYPRGGSVAVPATIVTGGRAHGLEVLVRAGVRRIHADGGRVRAVELEDGRSLEGRVVVSTSSLRDTVHMTGEACFPAEYVTRVGRSRKSYIAVQAKVALRRPLVRGGCVVGGVAEVEDGVDPHAWTQAQFRQLFAEFEAGKVPRVIPIYAPIPTSFDPALAPEGRQLITACALAPTSDVALETEPRRWEEALVRALEAVVPGIQEEAVFLDTTSVAFIERWIGKKHGPAVSTGQTPDQVGRKRPPVRTPVRGLYVCGDGAGGRGVGTELACESGIECANAVSRDCEWGLVD